MGIMFESPSALGMSWIIHSSIWIPKKKLELVNLSKDMDHHFGKMDHLYIYTYTYIVD